MGDMTLSMTTFNIMALTMTTVSIMGLFVTLSIMRLRKIELSVECNYAKCRYAESRVFIVMLSVIMVIVIMLSVIMVSLIILSVIYAKCHYAHCHYAECRYAECGGASKCSSKYIESYILFSASAHRVHWSQLCCTRGRSNSRFVFKSFLSVSIFGARTFPTKTLRLITLSKVVYIT